MADKKYERLEEQMKALEKRRLERKKRNVGQNGFIKSTAIEIGMLEGHEYWIVPNPMTEEFERMKVAAKADPKMAECLAIMRKHFHPGLNGYVVFKEKPVVESDYGSILTHVPVHGGITYANHDEKIGSVYGFDTAHCNSMDLPIDDKKWIRKQCWILIQGIKRAAEVEMKYITAKSQKIRAKHCQYVRDVAPKTELNFGESINLLFGEL